MGYISAEFAFSSASSASYDVDRKKTTGSVSKNAISISYEDGKVTPEE